jgi:hypothetical protein
MYTNNRGFQMGRERDSEGMEEVESALRDGRPEPSPEFVRTFSRHTAGSRRRRSRVGLSIGFTVVLFGALASFGGVGHAVNAVNDVVNSARVSPASVQYAAGTCVESVNPHGQTIPPAGQTPPGNGPGQNEDGFYEIGSDATGQVIVTDLGSGTVFGPYPSGTVIKYTQATGATPGEKKIGSDNGQAGAVYVHITGTGDFSVTPVGGGTSVTCLVPRPPK